jgi:hypothetical protein
MDERKVGREIRDKTCATDLNLRIGEKEVERENGRKAYVR